MTRHPDAHPSCRSDNSCQVNPYAYALGCLLQLQQTKAQPYSHVPFIRHSRCGSIPAAHDATTAPNVTRLGRYPVCLARVPQLTSSAHFPLLNMLNTADQLSWWSDKSLGRLLHSCSDSTPQEHTATGRSTVRACSSLVPQTAVWTRRSPAAHNRSSTFRSPTRIRHKNHQPPKAPATKPTSHQPGAKSHPAIFTLGTIIGKLPARTPRH